MQNTTISKILKFGILGGIGGLIGHLLGSFIDTFLGTIIYRLVAPLSAQVRYIFGLDLGSYTSLIYSGCIGFTIITSIYFGHIYFTTRQMKLPGFELWRIVGLGFISGVLGGYFAIIPSDELLISASNVFILLEFIYLNDSFSAVEKISSVRQIIRIIVILLFQIFLLTRVTKFKYIWGAIITCFIATTLTLRGFYASWYPVEVLLVLYGLVIGVVFGYFSLENSNNNIKTE